MYLTLEDEYRQWALTKRIINQLHKAMGNRRHNVMGPLERFLISSTNELRRSAAVCGDIAKAKIWGSDERALKGRPFKTVIYTDAGLRCISQYEMSPTEKFARDLANKCGETEGLALAEKILELIDCEFRAVRAGRVPRLAVKVATRNNNRALVVGNFAWTEDHPTRSWINRVGKEKVAKMLLRYEACANYAAWEVDPARLDLLFREVTHVGFASPLDARNWRLNTSVSLPRKSARGGPKWYSLFPDVDAPFGSSGDFFSCFIRDAMNDAAEGRAVWWVAPPYCEDVLERAVMEILMVFVAQAKMDARLPIGEQLERERAPLQVYFAGPAWEDAKFFQALKASPFLRAFHKSKRGTLPAVDRQGKMVSTAPMALFALSASEDQGLTLKMQQHLRDITLAEPAQAKIKKGRQTARR